MLIGKWRKNVIYYDDFFKIIFCDDDNDYDYV